MEKMFLSFFILLLWYFVYFIKLIVFEHFYFFKKIKNFGRLPTDLAFNSGALGGIIHVCARPELTPYVRTYSRFVHSSPGAESWRPLSWRLTGVSREPHLFFP